MEVHLVPLDPASTCVVVVVGTDSQDMLGGGASQGAPSPRLHSHQAVPERWNSSISPSLIWVTRT